MKRVVLAALFAVVFAQKPTSTPEYSLAAVRYATLPQFPAVALVMGAPKDEKLDIAMVIWLVRGGGRTILFDSGFYRRSGSRISRCRTTCVRMKFSARRA